MIRRTLAATLLFVVFSRLTSAATILTPPMDAREGSAGGTTYMECIIRNISQHDLAVTTELWEGDHAQETSAFALPPGEFAILKGRHVTGLWYCKFTLQDSNTAGRAFAIATIVRAGLAFPMVIPARSE